MQNRIQTLNIHLQNLIAAGEVIVRPASAVKELIENAIDAQSDEIIIHLENGGIKKIQIQDNGQGIHHKDLPLAIQNHATSKIQSTDDFFNILTHGFRGEALASIASISNFSIKSKFKNEEQAWQLIYSPLNHKNEIKPTNLEKGTQIVLDDLFFNLPARKKFLATDNTEYRHCVKVIDDFILIYPKITFKLFHQNQSIYQFNQCQSQADYNIRLNKVIDSQFADRSIRVDIEDDYTQWSLEGYIAYPDICRSSINYQHLYINNRRCVDKRIAHAITQAYSDFLHSDRKAMYVLNFKLPANELDVNVHPSKKEVRFFDANKVYGFFLQNLKKLLANNKPQNYIEKFKSNQQLMPNSFQEPLLKNDKEIDFSKNNRTESPRTFAPKEKYQPIFSANFNNSSSQTQLSSAKPLTQEKFFKIQRHFDQNPTTHQNNHSSFIQKQDPINSILETQNQEPEWDGTTDYPLGFAIAQLHKTFILAQNDLGLIVIDMHAAHERILYEKLKNKIHQNELSKQNLLIPERIILTQTEAEVFKQYQKQIHSMGFDLELEDETIIMKAIPDMIKSLDFVKVFRDILEELLETEQSSEMELKINEILANTACKSAIKTNDILNLEQMNQLLRQIENTQSASQCNHGRPTWKQINLDEINAWFWRGK